MPDKEQPAPQPSELSQGSEPSQGSAGVKTAEPKKKVPKRKPATKNERRQLPPYNVVLLNDDDHTVEYVVDMLKDLFGHPADTGRRMAMEVDSQGRVIVLTTHKEKAELKRDQIHSYGADFRLSASKGPMSALIEPAAS